MSDIPTMQYNKKEEPSKNINIVADGVIDSNLMLSYNIEDLNKNIESNNKNVETNNHHLMSMVEEIRSLSTNEPESNIKEDFMLRRLEFEKEKLEQDKQDLLEKYDLEKQENRSLFSTMSDKLSGIFENTNQSSDVKNYMKDYMLGPFSVLFSPVSSAMKDMGITIPNLLGNIADRDDELRDSKDAEREAIERMLDDSKEAQIRAKEDELLALLGKDDNLTETGEDVSDNSMRDVTPQQMMLPSPDMSMVVYEDMTKALSIIDDNTRELVAIDNNSYDLIKSESVQDNEYKEATLERFESIDDSLGIMEKDTSETAKNTRKDGGFISMLLSVLPMLIGGALSLDFKSILGDIFGGLWDIIWKPIEKVLAPIIKVFTDTKDWILDKLNLAKEGFIGIKDWILDKINSAIEGIAGIKDWFIGLLPSWMIDNSEEEKKRKALDRLESVISREQETVEKERARIQERVDSGDIEGGIFKASVEKLEGNLLDRENKLNSLIEEFNNLSQNLGSDRRISDQNEIVVDDAIIHKDGKIIRTHEDDNIIATKNDLTNIGFDNREVEKQVRDVTPDTSNEIRDLLIRQNELLENLEATIREKPFNNVMNSVNNNTESKKYEDLDVIRNIGRR